MKLTRPVVVKLAEKRVDDVEYVPEGDVEY